MLSRFKEIVFNTFYFSLFIYLLFLSAIPSHAQTTPLPLRNVSGILTDSLNKPITDAIVQLKSAKDTLTTKTNVVGYWGFKDVKSAEFTISVRSMGYAVYNKKYFNNDTKAQLNIPPIQLGSSVQILETVTIKGIKGPTIKGDTTEFWAKDYIVRDYARLGDLLKRIEGITIDAEGSVFYNGERIVRALFNGSSYFSGDIKTAIKELPADIIERIQIIDQNENAIDPKKLKTEQSTKVLNVVTKPDMSAGKMYELKGEQGSSERWTGIASTKKIDGKNQQSVNLGYTQNPLGLNQSRIPGTIGSNLMQNNSDVSSGKNQKIDAGLYKSFQFGKFSFSPNYTYARNINNSVTKSFSETYYDQGNLSQDKDQNAHSSSNKHTFTANLFAPLEKNGNLSGNFNLNYQDGSTKSQNTWLQQGLVNNTTKEISSAQTKNLDYSFNLSISKNTPKYTFKTDLQSTFGNPKSKSVEDITIFSNQAPDSIINQLKNSKDLKFLNMLSNTLTWNYTKHLKLQGSLSPYYRHSLRDIQTYLVNDMVGIYNSDLSNYQLENLFGIPLKFTAEYNFDKGFYISPSLSFKNQWLSGKINQGLDPIARFDALLEPGLGLGYINKSIGKVDLYYNRLVTQPNLTQLNPNPYYINPYNIQIGNPNLENNLQSLFNLRYNYFLKRWRLNLALMSMYSVYERFTTNNRSIYIEPNSSVYTTINTFTNIEGGQTFNTRVDLSKTLTKGNTSINFSANLQNGSFPYLANGNFENRKSQQQDFYINVFFSKLKWLEVTPEIKYTSMVDKNTLVQNTIGKTYNQIFLANLKLGIYLPNNWAINSSISQSVYHTTNVVSNTSPLVINANIEKRLFKQKNAILSFALMDLARQNMVIGYKSSIEGYTNRVTNPESRYYLIQFSWSPQVWGKSKFDSGKGRKGDGSFVN